MHGREDGRLDCLCSQVFSAVHLLETHMECVAGVCFRLCFSNCWQKLSQWWIAWDMFLQSFNPHLCFLKAKVKAVVKRKKINIHSQTKERIANPKWQLSMSHQQNTPDIPNIDYVWMNVYVLWAKFDHQNGSCRWPLGSIPLLSQHFQFTYQLSTWWTHFPSCSGRQAGYFQQEVLLCMPYQG